MTGTEGKVTGMEGDFGVWEVNLVYVVTSLLRALRAYKERMASVVP